MSHDLKDQIREVAVFIDESQTPIRGAEVRAGTVNLVSGVDGVSRPLKRTLVVVAAFALVLILVGGVAWLAPFDSSGPPAGELTETTILEVTTPTTQVPPATDTPTTTVAMTIEPPALVAPQVDWVDSNLAPQYLSITDLTTGNGTSVIVGESIWTSVDGIEWAVVNENARAQVVIYSDDRFLAGFQGSAWSSQNGVSWEPEDLDSSLDIEVWSLAYGDPGYVAAGLVETSGSLHAAITYSQDGVAWNRVPNTGNMFGDPEQPFRWLTARDVAYGPEGYVVVGEDDFAGGGMKVAIWISPDGTTWNRVEHDDAVFGGSSDDEWFNAYAVASGGAGYVAVGEIDSSERHTGAVWFSPDGHTWELVIDQPAFTGPVTLDDVVAIEAGYVAVGDDLKDGTPLIWFSSDGRIWSQLETDDLPAVEGAVGLDKITSDGNTIMVVGRQDFGDDSRHIVWQGTIHQN
jgi:hypothetical protein